MSDPTPIPTRTMLPLGALVRHDARDAYICAASHDNPARYQVTYCDGAQPARRDHLEARDLEVIDCDPAEHELTPVSLRWWLTGGRPVVGSQ